MFETVRLAKNELPPSCAHCHESFEAGWSLSNLGRSEQEKRVKVVAHKVDEAYHGALHPKCFRQMVEESLARDDDPRCAECHIELDQVDGKSVYDPKADVDESQEAVIQRGQLLQGCMMRTFHFPFYASSKKNEVRKILSTGGVLVEDRSQAAINAVLYGNFDCLPLLLRNGHITQVARNQILDMLNPGTNGDLVRLLIPLGLSDQRQQRLLVSIAQVGDLETLQALLDYKTQEGRGFPQEILDQAVEAASGRGDLPLVRALLDFAEVSEAGCVAAIENAAASQVDSLYSREVVQLLLERAELSGYARSAAIAKAVAKLRLDIAWDVGTQAMPSCTIL